MYFLHLSGYNPKNGINTDKHSRFPFISAIDALFEPATPFLDYHLGFPFIQIEIDNQATFYISEPNLIKIFKNNISGKNEIWLDKTSPITQNYTDELIQLFYNGYTAGFNSFNIEIGSAYPALSLAHKKEMLEQFMDYCQRDLYFEGFAIPELLHNLGYIQAGLVQAFKEYRNLSNLSLASKDTNLLTSPTESVPTLIGETIHKNPFQKVLLKYPSSDIRTIWLSLLDLPKSRSLNLTQEFKTEDDILELLGSMFTDISGEANKLPDSPHHFYEIPLDYQQVLYLLMHATYKLNYTYTRLPLDEYSKCLKATFSVFKAIELNHMPGNFTKKQTVAISALNELTNSSHAKNALQILAKIPNYRITL